MDGEKWMKQNWPNARAVDHDWTMEKYDYPQYVREWIKKNWIKVNDNNGGTYYEKNYFESKNLKI